MATEQAPDPILVRRARAARWARLGRRLGYLLFAFSILAFLFGLITGFSAAVSRVVVFGVIAGSVVLAPAIIAGYAVTAAVRDDVEHGRPV